MTATAIENDKALKEGFDRDGYVCLRGFLDPQEVRWVSERMDRFIREVVPTLPPEEAFYEIKGDKSTLKQLQKPDSTDPVFRAFFEGPRFTNLAELLLGGPVVRKPLQWFNKPARVGSPTPPHQDGYYFMIEPNEALTMWLALDDVDTTNGCVRYIPGSHRTGMRPHTRTQVIGFSQGITDYGPEDHRQEFIATAKPGDLLAHHSLTVHRADANRSDRPRRALGQVFFSASAKSDPKKIEQYMEKLHKEWREQGKI